MNEVVEEGRGQMRQDLILFQEQEPPKSFRYGTA